MNCGHRYPPDQLLLELGLVPRTRGPDVALILASRIADEMIVRHSHARERVRQFVAAVADPRDVA